MKSSFFTKTAAIAGFALGAFALSVLAAGTWNPPSLPPPDGNAEAPINVGNIMQNKLGWLGVKGLVATDLTLATGTPAKGMVLTAIDSVGNAAWALPTTNPVPPTSQTSECTGEGLVHVIPNTVMTDTGSSASDDSMEIYCRSGVARFCLSKEACPWRTDIASDDSHVCSMAGLVTSTTDPDNANLKLMVTATGDLWRGHQKYYCGVNGTVKDSYYTTNSGARLR